MIGFVKRKLDIFDLLWISIVSIIVIIHGLLRVADFKMTIYEIFVSFGFSYTIIATSFGIKFKNIIFSLIWIVLFSINLIISNDVFLASLPIVITGLYHLIRFSYWIKYKTEFIPLWMSRGGTWLRYSDSEEREANKNDKFFSFLMFFIGAFIIMIYVYIN